MISFMNMMKVCNAYFLIHNIGPSMFCHQCCLRFHGNITILYVPVEKAGPNSYNPILNIIHIGGQNICWARFLWDTKFITILFFFFKVPMGLERLHASVIHH